MIALINDSWDWLGIKAKKIIRINDFGNVIFKSNDGDFWRICPEELYCKKIANEYKEYDILVNHPEFISNWEMDDLIKVAKASIVELKAHEKYCLKIPAVLGGEYSEENIGIISQVEQIKSSGNLAMQIKDLPDGTDFKLNFNDK